MQNTHTFLNHLILSIAMVSFFSLVSCVNETTVEVDPQVQPPDAPLLFNLTELISEPMRGLRISFQYSGGDANGFLLQRSEQGAAFDDYTMLGPSTSSDDEANFDDWDVQMSQLYVYRIRAFNDHGNSDWSSEQSQNAPGPQTKALSPATAISDAYVDEAFPNTNYGDVNHLLVTNSSSEYSLKRIAYIRFPIDGIPSHAVDVEYADVSFLSPDEPANGTPVIHVFRSLDDWSESTLTWNSRPERTSYALDLNKVVNNDGNFYTWEISQEVRWWWDATNLNYGIVFESASPTDQAVLLSREHASSVRPQIRIVYVW